MKVYFSQRCIVATFAGRHSFKWHHIKDTFKGFLQICSAMIFAFISSRVENKLISTWGQNMPQLGSWNTINKSIVSYAWKRLSSSLLLLLLELDSFFDSIYNNNNDRNTNSLWFPHQVSSYPSITFDANN